MDASSLLDVATRTLVEPWSSVADKLNAIAGLEGIGSDDSVKALVQGMSLAGLYSSEALKNSPTLPLLGEVAGAASRAVGRTASNREGATRLLEIAVNPAHPISLRECAVYGLGGLTSKSAFDAYTELMRGLSPTLLLRVFSVVEESLAKVDHERSPYVGVFLVALFSKLARLFERMESPELVERGVKILGRYLPLRGREEIRALAASPRRRGESAIAVQVLLAKTGREPDPALLTLFVKRGYDPTVYREFGRAYAANTTPAVRNAAEFVLSRSTSYDRMLRFVFRDRAEMLEAQEQAARLMLGVGRRGV